jgi:hypothetical protein
MSAPPTAAVSVYPLMKLSKVFKPKYPAATAGTAGAAAKNPPRAARFIPSKEPLIRCRPGSMRGLDDTFPASLRKATIEPVNVTPPFPYQYQHRGYTGHETKSIPIRTPRYAVTRCSVVRWSPAVPITLPMLVSTAARPTTECNAATICGSSVAVMRRPMIAPTVPPIAATPANCASTSGGKPTAAREARMPEPTPRIPSALP